MLRLTDDAHSELLNGLEALFNLVYLAEHGSRAETQRYLADMKDQLQKVALIAARIEGC